MRILMTTDTVGGVWSFTCELTEQLLIEGHAVHLVSFGRLPSPAQQDWVAEQGPSFSYTPTEVALEWMQDNEEVFELGEGALRKISAVFQPDLAVANQFCFGRLAASVPTVVVAHSDVLSWAQACNPAALEPSPWLDRYISLVQAGLHAASAVVAPTAWMGAQLAANFELPRHLFVIPNGLTVRHPDASLIERRIQAITAGRLWDVAKGLDTLEGVRSPMPILIAGENSFAASEAKVAWPRHFEQLGPLRREELLQKFRESSVYICASRYEPFGLAPLEAALCGCAIVARDLPSLREVWDEAATYFSDERSLEAALLRLAHDGELLQAARARAHERALRFSGHRMTDSYLHLFHSLVTQQAVQHVA